MDESLKRDLILEKIAIYEQKLYKSARTSFKAFTLATFPTYIMNWHHEVLIKVLQNFSEKKIKNLMINIPPQCGKLIEDSYPVLTRYGWKNHGDLRVGDAVIGSNGRFTPVVGISRPEICDRQLLLENRKGHAFAVKCHRNHIWPINFYEKGKQVPTTQNMATGEIQKYVNTNSQMWINCLDYVFSENSPLLIPPYLMGLWLTSPYNDKFVIGIPKIAKENVCQYIQSLGYGYKFIAEETEKYGRYYIYIPQFDPHLQVLGLIGNKSLLGCYISAKESDRAALLSGLYDSGLGVVISTMGENQNIYNQYGVQQTKGTRNITYSFALSNISLANDVACVLRSLGMEILSITTADIKRANILGELNSKQVTVRLNRALDLKSVQEDYHYSDETWYEDYYYIKEIINCENEGVYGKCIQVANDDGIYAIGKEFLLTHNSELVSRRYPAYKLGIHPDTKIACATYATEFAKTFSRDVERIVQSNEYRKIFPDTRVAPKMQRSKLEANAINNAQLFEVIGRRGSFQSISTDSPITGKTVDLGMIDDPVKGRADAESVIERNRVWNWYLDDFLTRLHNDSQQLLTMTRWHEDDLAGRILKKNRDKWTVITIPQIRESVLTHPDDPREEGEVLWPEKHDLESVLEIKNHSLRSFVSLHQQRPAPEEGNIIMNSWWRFWDILPEDFDDAVFSWDCSFKDEKESDHVVGQVWIANGPNRYLVDEVRGRWDFIRTMREMLLLREKYPEIKKMLIEDKANGPAIITTLRTKIQGILPSLPTDSKVTRLKAVALQIEGGNVYLPRKDLNPWVEDYLDEFRMFPNGSEDDRVDASSQALKYLEPKSDGGFGETLSFISLTGNSRWS